MTGFNPFAAGTPDVPETSDVLADLSRRGTGSSLEQSLDALGELLTRIKEQDTARGDDGVPAELVPVLEELTGADDAPLAYRSLHRRVAEGSTNWDAFWRAPQDAPEGLRLLNDALRVSGAGLAEGLARLGQEKDGPGL